MQEIANTLIDSAVQCWACPIFDNLFAVVSNSAAAVYERLSVFSVVIFSILFGFYILNAFWQNVKSGMSDPFFQKSLKPVLIKSLMILSLFALGLNVPRFISKITFEPVATITLQFSKIILPENNITTNDYQKLKLNDDGFFNPELRDTIVEILQTSVASFQIYIKMGIEIIGSVFTLPERIDIGVIVKHLLVFFVGLVLTYYFVRWFIKYSFCFVDIIVAMAMFAFFFPLSLGLFIFQGASDLPDWMKNLGKTFGGKQIKQLINAIVSVATTILMYTIIVLLIRGYIYGNNVDVDSMQNSVASIMNFDLDNPNSVQITFFGSIVLVVVLNYLIKQIPNITKEIMSVFGVSQENQKSEEMGKNVLALTDIVANQTKQLVKNIVNPQEQKTDDKQTDSKGKEAKK